MNMTPVVYGAFNAKLWWVFHRHILFLFCSGIISRFAKRGDDFIVLFYHTVPEIFENASSTAVVVKNSVTCMILKGFGPKH